ncbi:hypothetical protein Chor_009635 [Crotalus horridus]
MILSLSFPTEPPKAPSVFPLSPSGQNGVATSPPSDISIGCLVKSYFPEPATVQWNSGAITSGIHNFPPVLHPSGQYTHTSLLTIPFSKWESETFHCNVEHAATNSRINKNIERCEAHEPVSPEVHLLHSSCNPKDSDGTIELVCLIESFYPNEINVDWLVGSHYGLLAPYTEPPRRDVNKYTFSTVSRVNITQADWLEGNTYYCQVTHAASQTRVKGRARKCEDASSHFATGVTAYLLPPRPKDLYINRNARLVCVVVNLQQEEGLKISWSREKKVAMHPELVVVTEENNGTFTAVGRYPVSALDWESGETFTCSVEYPGLPGPIVNTISKSPEKSKAPSIHIYPPIPGNSLTVTCLIEHFFPVDNDVQWLKNGNAISEDNYVNTPAVKEKRDESYFRYSKLSIPESDWDAGNTFSCMFVHEALDEKFIQRNIAKTSVDINPSLVDKQVHPGILWIWMQRTQAYDETVIALIEGEVDFRYFVLMKNPGLTSLSHFTEIRWIASALKKLKKKPVGPHYKNIIHQRT